MQDQLHVLQLIPRKLRQTGSGFVFDGIFLHVLLDQQDRDAQEQTEGHDEDSPVEFQLIHHQFAHVEGGEISQG